MKHSENLVKAALDMVLTGQGGPYYNVNGLLTADETNALNARPDRVKRNLLEKFEADLLTNYTHQLRYDRHNDSVIYFRSTAGQEGDCTAQLARYWYRAMKKEEFQLHKKSDEFAEMPDFCRCRPKPELFEGISHEREQGKHPARMGHSRCRETVPNDDSQRHQRKG